MSEVVDLAPLMLRGRRANQPPVQVLVGRDDLGLCADVDGVEFRAESVGVLMRLVADYVTREWGRS